MSQVLNCLLVVCDENTRDNQIGVDLLQSITNEELGETFTGNTPMQRIWKLKNKYFCADVSICLCADSNLKDMKKENFEQLEAVVFLFQLHKAGSLKRVQQVRNLLQREELEICLLFNTEKQLVEEDSLHTDILKWSVENSYEFVQYVTEDNTSTKEEGNVVDKFEEKVGIKRIVEALNSHVWSNHSRNDNEKKVQAVPNCDNILEGMGNGQSFDELFAKFHQMKVKAQSLEGDAKKDYAEKVALAFMEAMGFDDEDEN